MAGVYVVAGLFVLLALDMTFKRDYCVEPQNEPH